VRDRGDSSSSLSETSQTSSFSSDESESDSNYRRGYTAHRRYRIENEDDSEEESDVNRDAYAFSLPRRSRSPLNQVGTSVRSEPSNKTEAGVESRLAASSARLGTTLHVYRSRYTGDGSIGDVQSAQLNVVQNPSEGRPPLFRWM
jgi:hypothetical protein